MDFGTLVALVQERDVRLSTDGDALSYDGPPGAITDELLAALRHHKAELVSWLTGRGPGGQVVAWAPATPEQDRMSRRTQILGNPVASHLAQLITLTGYLDTAALNAALTALFARHCPLRTRFVRRGERLVQEVLAARPVGLAVRDLRAAPDPAAAACEWCWQEAHRPFQLDRPPLLRTHLLRVADDEWILLLVFHHVIVDGWSLAIFYDELAALYTAASAAGPLSALDGVLRPLAQEYPDYARWCDAQLDDTWLDTVVDYWRSALDGATLALELPYDRPRPVHLSGHGRVHDFTVGPDTVERLETVARRHDATLFTVVASGLALLLSRLSDQDDIVVVSSYANRVRAEHEQLIGLLARGMTLRFRLGAARTFTDLIEQTRDATYAALHHQPVPVDRLLDLLAPDRDPNTPLFRAGIVLVNSPAIRLALPDLTVRIEDMHLDCARSDLTTIMAPAEGGGLSGGCEYPTDLFDPDTVAAWITDYVGLLDQVSRDPTLPLDRYLTGAI